MEVSWWRTARAASVAAGSSSWESMDAAVSRTARCWGSERSKTSRQCKITRWRTVAFATRRRISSPSGTAAVVAPVSSTSREARAFPVASFRTPPISPLRTALRGFGNATAPVRTTSSTYQQLAASTAVWVSEL